MPRGIEIATLIARRTRRAPRDPLLLVATYLYDQRPKNERGIEAYWITLLVTNWYAA